MPKNPRQHWKTELERASNNLDWAMEHCRRMMEEYRPVHPEIADQLEAAMQGTLMVQELINSIRETI